MKAKINDSIITVVPVKSEFSEHIIPKGTKGTIVEAYAEPEEHYAVDTAEAVSGDSSAPPRYDNVVLHPDQFEVTTSGGASA